MSPSMGLPPASQSAMPASSGATTRSFDWTNIVATLSLEPGSAAIVNIGNVEAVLDLLERFPEAELTVEGHTDSVGSAQANEALSRKRANSVGEAFVDMFGVKRSRITTQGFGAANPVADNATAEGRAANRRVEVVVTPGV